MIKKMGWCCVLFLVGWLATGCLKSSKQDILMIDGSSTVFPITEAVAEEFQKKTRTRVAIGVSGTGGGFKKFCQGEIWINGASRPITSSEIKMCGKKNIKFVELPIAYDGIAIVVNKKNTWVKSLTVAQLKKLWEPAAQKKVMKWNQLDPSWPDKNIQLYGPGVDSGTYDYFTLSIVGKQHASRGDYISSENDNVLVQGVAGDEKALGFFGLAYYVKHKSKLKLVPIDDGNDNNGKGAVAPDFKKVADGFYQPLTRPLFLYVNAEKSKHPLVQSFIKFYLHESRALVKEIGYVPLPKGDYHLVEQLLRGKVGGTHFHGVGIQVGKRLKELLKHKKNS